MFQLDFYSTLVAASLVLLLGRWLVARIGFLRAYSIPEPVVGGLLVAALLLLLRALTDIEVRFDASLQAPLMLAFFATIGLNADFASLKKGGRILGIFLLVVTALLVVQNAMGIALAKALGLDPLMGLLAGSVTLSGGHGTGAAWGAVFSEKYGVASASELAIASATFGLVLGGLIGGPVARLLIKRVQVPGVELAQPPQPKGFEQPNQERMITSFSFIETLALLAISLQVGTFLYGFIKGTAFELPTFVCVLFVGVVLRNGLSALGWHQVFEREVSLLGNVSLSLFLAIALMSLKLWDLAALALPIVILLAAQALLMALFAIFVTFRVMGRNYDAAVLAAGHCGFGLGATPTAIANMQAVTQRFGPSPIAFLVVPMVGAFFIDITNAVVIKLYLALPFLGAAG
ncbi:sodium/glutamate symporter [Pseudomonas sp. WS 5532]|jgi:ESS family glutamate:Na+ symporter|uniref:Sodium/glutamate symporter n=2 Tax=Pseudomonas edaphica TaxID=2006980 RepID=A0A7Y7RQX5_9PSED|nr:MULTISPECIES: sodium/glutamate symporter [Pseudomonas]MCF5233375.1 sodium/glutamate symporter [Pseudomonas sp. PA-5-4H]MCF5239112.1 sodium/glutamate symporter [Pseudomonas sp. PA-5-4G]MCF5249646.1 sodium/glutamate symporter [Pseudomonas sp. PA-5-4B]MCF5253239.1 sodium/glutamate symporter [Pseudomonas sp. PA-5-4B]MCF5263381.1 sodium/glutamate symporter [Pseudomonas sp. PA-5-4A]